MAGDRTGDAVRGINNAVTDLESAAAILGSMADTIQVPPASVEEIVRAQVALDIVADKLAAAVTRCELAKASPARKTTAAPLEYARGTGRLVRPGAKS